MSSLSAVVFASAAALAGCGEDGLPGNPADALCCTDFKVGADMSATDWGLDAEANARFTAFAQASGDLSAVATGAMDDMFIACQNIAIDLGADPEDPSVANATGKGAMEAWCTLAVGQINAKFSGSGSASLGVSLSIDYAPPQCSVSVAAKFDCQASCEGSASCDFEANPPTCEGGELSFECSGACEASAEAPSVSCTGSCSGECSGSCTAEAGATIACQGKCDGTCSAGAMGGGTGIQADGTCDGECEGTCEMAADATVECSGTCGGSCEGTCEADPGGASIQCEGECMGEVSAPKCEGGEISGGCEASAECQGSCDGSASAKAECTPPSVAITYAVEAAADFDLDAQIQVDAAIASLKANLPNILIVLEARGQAFAGALEGVLDAGASVSGEVTGSVEATACALAIVAVIGEAAGNFEASLSAAIDVGGSLDIGG